MDLTPYVASLRDDLAAAAAVGDEATTRAGSSLAAALEPAVRLALMNALSDLAGEVTEALGDRTVSLRLSGREVKVAVERADSSTQGGHGSEGFFAGPASSPFAGTPGGGPGGPHRSTPPPPPGPGFPGAEAFSAAFGGQGFGGQGFGGQGFGGQGFGGRGGPDASDISRMTLRLVDQIKGQAERAAASQGMSLNSWIAQAVQGALQDKRRGGGGGWGDWGGDRGADRGADPGSGSGWTGGRPNDEPAPDRSADTGKPADTDKPADPEKKDGPDDGGVDGWVKG